MDRSLGRDGLLLALGWAKADPEGMLALRDAVARYGCEASGVFQLTDEEVVAAVAQMLASGVLQRCTQAPTLRRLSVAAQAPQQRTAVTPSQLRRSRASEQEPEPPQPLHWIEIKLVGDDGVGIPDEEYLVVAPDQTRHGGRTDPSGGARVSGIPGGSCAVSFPRLDQRAWHRA